MTQIKLAQLGSDRTVPVEKSLPQYTDQTKTSIVRPNEVTFQGICKKKTHDRYQHNSGASKHISWLSDIAHLGTTANTMDEGLSKLAVHTKGGNTGVLTNAQRKPLENACLHGEGTNNETFDEMLPMKTCAAPAGA